MVASFSSLVEDLPSIALIGLHNLKLSELWSSISMNCLRCLVVALVVHLLQGV